MAETVHYVLQKAAVADPDKLFLVEGSKTVTFREMDQLSTRFASALANKGIGKGDRIGMLGLNQIEWLVTLFAASKIGASLVALNVRYRVHEFQYMLNHAGVKAVVSISEFMDHNFSELFQSFRDSIPTVEIFIFIGEGGFEGSHSYEALMEEPADENKLAARQREVQPEDTIIMIYTSGTTGKPKAAAITHRSILASAQAQVEHFEVTEQDTAIGALPLNHVGGITCTLMVAILSKSKVVLIPTFIPNQVLRALREHEASIIGGVPTMYQMLFHSLRETSEQFAKVRLCIAGGSQVDAQLVEGISNYFPNGRVVNLYGLSETSGACVLSGLSDSIEHVSKSLGVPIGDYEIKVVDAEWNELPAGETGELAVKGPGVVQSYYKMPEETNKTFSEGWLYTGDIVMRDPDGYLYFKGRKKDIFVQGGFNVYPMEIESVLMKHPKVETATGVGIPDSFLGEIGVYYIVPKAGKTPTEEELKQFCEEQMADYKVPKKIIFVEEIPLTASGKIQKARLKEMYLEQAEEQSTQ